jgi:hypothetical protein
VLFSAWSEQWPRDETIEELLEVAVFSVRSVPWLNNKKNMRLRIVVAVFGNMLKCQTKITVTEARGRIRNPEEEERPPLQAITKTPVKTVNRTTVCVCVCACARV